MNGKTYTPIACGDFDYLEIACMDNYDVELVMHNEHVRGRAITTNNDKTGEFLVIETEGGERLSLRADLIHKIIVRSKNARFREHTFTPTA